MNHGHVHPNPDGSKARCGGPPICPQCAQEYAQTQIGLKPLPDTTVFLAQYAQLQRRIAQEMTEYEADRQAILAPVAEALAELECNHKDCIEPLQAELASLEAQIKAAALAGGRSVKAHGWHAVVMPGRVSWDTSWLEGYAATHEEILQAKKLGQPSVSLREVK